MRKAAFILGSFLTSFLLNPVPGGSAAPASPTVRSASVRTAIEAAVEKERKVYGGRTPVPAVLIGVWDSTGASYIHAFGYADLAKRRPLSPADHFRIGSNTKTFVVSVLLQLVDEGKLSLDDTITRFPIGVTVPNGKNITVRELCNMRSGLFEAYDTPQFDKMDVTPQMLFNSRQVIRWAVAQKPYFPPNKGYHYSNTNYLILGLIIEAITHDTVGNQIRTRLLEPFKLTQTSYPDSMAMPDPWAHGYGLGKAGNWEDVSNTIPISLMGSAGEMISDMSDMKRWIELYTTGKVSKPATFRALTDCIPVGDGNLSFGLGLGCSVGWFGYTGGLPGYNTADYYFPATHTTVVAWVTLQKGNPAPGVANAIFRDIAQVMTPNNVPFQKAANKSGL